jgi:hypothetical protein
MEEVAEYWGLPSQAVNKRCALRQLVGLRFRKRGACVSCMAVTGQFRSSGPDQRRTHRAGGVEVVYPTCKATYIAQAVTSWVPPGTGSV